MTCDKCSVGAGRWYWTNSKVSRQTRHSRAGDRNPPIFGRARAARRSSRARRGSRSTATTGPISGSTPPAAIVERYRRRRGGDGGPERGAPPGRPRRTPDRSRTDGLETLTIEFDPAWLRLWLQRPARPLADLERWAGGPRCARSRRRCSARPWRRRGGDRPGDRCIPQRSARSTGTPRRRHGSATRGAGCRAAPRFRRSEVARRLELNPDYLARAYRGGGRREGIGETLRRRRVEQASALASPDRIAAGRNRAWPAGFCDQSHMNRCFARGARPDAVAGSPRARFVRRASRGHGMSGPARHGAGPALRASRC